MGISTHIVGFKDTEEHEKHIRIWKMCLKESVSLPKETAAYFGDDSEGLRPDSWSEDEIEEKLEVSLGIALTVYEGDMVNGFEVDVKALPKEVTRIRFFNSY